MTKKLLVQERLGELLIELDLRAGDRLPPERELARRLDVSRNTLRGALRAMEERGLVKIRPGSGCYLRARISTLGGNPLDAQLPAEKIVADQLEAAYIALPSLALLAARRITERQIDELHACSVSLSRSIFQDSSEKVWNESLTFFRLVAMATGNDFLVRSVEQICSYDMAPYDNFFSLRREDREAVFADHVKILNALRARDGEAARRVTKEFILRLCGILEDSQDGSMTDLMYRKLSQRRLAAGEGQA